MTAAPLFSIIIPVYNRASLVSQTINSVFSQTFTNYEVIAIDDGSIDASLETLKHFEPRIRVLHQANSGPSIARNNAAAQARGSYLIFLDSDDIFYPWTLEVLAEAITAANDPVCVSGRAVKFDHDSQPPPLVRVTPNLQSAATYFDGAWRSFACVPSAMAVRTDAFHRVGGFDPALKYAEDHDVIMKLGTDPTFVNINQPPLVALRRGHASLVANHTAGLAAWRSLVDREFNGGYPGGPALARTRRTILATNIKRFLRGAQAPRADRLALFSLIRPWLFAAGEVRFALLYPLMAR